MRESIEDVLFRASCMADFSFPTISSQISGRPEDAITAKLTDPDGDISQVDFNDEHLYPLQGYASPNPGLPEAQDSDEILFGIQEEWPQLTTIYNANDHLSRSYGLSTMSRAASSQSRSMAYQDYPSMPPPGIPATKRLRLGLPNGTLSGDEQGPMLPSWESTGSNSAPRGFQQHSIPCIKKQPDDSTPESQSPSTPNQLLCPYRDCNKSKGRKCDLK